jgi:integrase
MRKQPHDGIRLFGPSGSRKYLNAAERWRFLESVQRLPSRERSFCQMLAWSGARISEVLALTPSAIDIESGAASITTLRPICAESAYSFARRPSVAAWYQFSTIITGHRDCSLAVTSALGR